MTSPQTQTTAASAAGPVSEFAMRLASELVSGCSRYESDNVDEIRFPGRSWADRVKNQLNELAGRFGLFRVPLVDREIFGFAGLSGLYDLLEDEASKELLIRILAFRVLGDRHVRLPLNTPHYWALRRSVAKYIEDRGTIKGDSFLRDLHRFNIRGVRLNAHPLNILNTFLLEQYRCARASVGVKPGDIVIDCGGCWGDTALEFALTAGHVYCFECMPSNIAIFKKNLELNPALASKITLVGKALSGRSGEKLSFLDSGAGSRSSEGGSVEVETITIDDFVSENGIGRVDLIKMDIEGSEPVALAGARGTLLRSRPDLAISLYHDIEHFVSIPAWLDGLNAGYRFYLDHFTIHLEETVLFCKA
ncbi:MAG: FkbM family methyltransferase [Acidobacteriota bacterium]|nr:FkbM family methyltransferase [Acidobacteriota bacterium]